VRDVVYCNTREEKRGEIQREEGILVDEAEENTRVIVSLLQILYILHYRTLHWRRGQDPLSKNGSEMLRSELKKS
jgi:hypothetical protein